MAVCCHRRLSLTISHLSGSSTFTRTAAANGGTSGSSILLWPDGAPNSSDGGDFQPSLDIRLHQTATVPLGAVLIMPGGGYGGRATDHEGYQIADRCNQAGYHAFILQYRVSPNVHPAPLLDASRAIRLIRAHAEEWKVASDQIAVMGFSAGGHLAGSISVLHHKFPFSDQDLLASKFSNRPDATILCYAVISSGEYAHNGSFNNLLGADATEAERQEFSLEEHVDDRTPPAFLWHTTGDIAVPVENSMLYASSLRKFNTKFEMHVYPGLPHGIGLGDGENGREGSMHVGTWHPLAMGWLAVQGWTQAPSPELRSGEPPSVL